MVRLTIADGILIAWLIYGNKLFYSNQNDCATKSGDTQFLNIMMHTILVMGYFSMIVYFYILFTSACGSSPPQNTTRILIESLSRIQFTEGKFDHDSQCVICLNEYEQTDTITCLECDPRHYFHTKCLESSIEAGHLDCPLCRVKIVQRKQEDLESQSLIDEIFID